MGRQAFDKFINKDNGAKKREEIRQDKKKFKAELKAGHEEQKRLNEDKYRIVTSDNLKKSGTNEAKSKASNQKSAESRGRKTGDNQRFATGAPKPAGRGRKAEEPKEFSAGNRKAVDVGKRPKADKMAQEDEKPFTPRERKPKTDTKEYIPDTHREKKSAADGASAPADRICKQPDTDKKHLSADTRNQNSEEDSIMPLNKYIAHAGICGRREAAELVKAGFVVVNGDKILEPGHKVTGADKVTVKGKQIFPQKNLVYILLNKPKDFLTTAKDPQGRKTVLDLVKHATQERIYSVGRLDRNTTGVLLLTNDGELAQKLTHPSFEVKKVYEVKLDKPVVKKDFEAILNGVTLEDGFVQADSLGYTDAKDKSIVGIEIHSGRNRIVRRIFEHLGYDVKNLDRVMFGNLTKKNVDRGKWRMLTEKEVRLLKYMNQSFVKKKDKKDAAQ